MTTESEGTRGPEGAAAAEEEAPSGARGGMERPARTYETGRVTRLIRLGTLVLTAVVAVALLGGYFALPQTIPTHYNLAGEPDAWGSRSSVFLLVGIFVAIVAGTAWLSHHPRVFNYPGVVTEYNAQEMYRAGEQTMVWACAACALIFGGIAASTLFAINSSVVIVPGIVAVAASVVVGVARMLRA